MTAHRVVVNAEEQYSLWSHDRPAPPGWATVFTGDLDACLAYITEHWTDQRPLSLRSTKDDAAAPAEAGIHALVESACDVDPGRIAVRYAGDTLTAGELATRMRRWARLLRAHGSGPETPVAVLLPRSLDAVTAILAVLRAGSAYLALSVNDPPDRIRRILADAGNPIVLTESKHTGLLPDAYPGTVLDVFRLPEPPADADDSDGGVRPDNLAFIVYTSGTSGAPKGVLGTHKQLTNYVRWCAEEFPMRPGERAVLHAPLYFVGSVMTLFTALVAGWELEVAPEPVGFDALIALTAEAPCGFLKLTPSHVRAMTALGGVDDIARQVMIGSEPLYLTPEFDEWIRSSPNSRFGNHYGMSETVGATWLWIGDDREPGRRLPVGGPIPNAQIHLLGEHGQTVPIGQPGEVYLGGAVIGRGYHGQPALTAQRWVPHPSEPGGRLLRTGDLGVMLPGGVLDVLGRADRQVKIRGQRVEPPSVEDALRRCPGIAEAVVVPEPDGHELHLVAYLRADGDPPPTEAELRRHAASLLPDASIPARMFYVAQYPLTPNGKVDTRRLASVPVVRPTLSTGYAAPRTELERSVAQVVGSVLRLERVGLDDDFFELGGDSMRIVEVVTRLDDELGRSARITDVFDHPTVRGLAAVLAIRADTEPETAAAQPIRHGPVGSAPVVETELSARFTAEVSGTAPLTWGQLSMYRPLRWFGDASADFNLKRVLRFAEPVSLDAFIACWARLAECQQILRTLIHEGPSGPWQEVHSHGVYPLSARETSMAELDATADAATAELAATAFHLDREWPVRLVLLRVEGLVAAVGFAASHAPLDGWALELLIGELRELVEGDRPLPPPGWQPLDQAAYEHSPAGRRHGRQAIAFWREHMRGAPAQLFPGPGRDAGPLPIMRWRMESAAIAAVSAELAQRTGTSSSTVVLTATLLALRALTGRDHLVVKLIAGNRYTPRQRELAAAMAQDALFAFDVGDGDGFGDVEDLIARCYRESTEAYFHGGYSPDDLAALMAAEGAGLDLTAYFNDARMGRDWEPMLPAGFGRSDVDDLRERTTVAPMASLAKHDMSFYAHMPYLAGSCALQLLADTRRLAPDDCLRALRGMENLLCEAALRKVSLAEVNELLGLPGAGPDE